MSNTYIFLSYLPLRAPQFHYLNLVEELLCSHTLHHDTRCMQQHNIAHCDGTNTSLSCMVGGKLFYLITLSSHSGAASKSVFIGSILPSTKGCSLVLRNAPVRFDIMDKRYGCRQICGCFRSKVGALPRVSRTLHKVRLFLFCF